jgi:hypothetical protein
LITDFSGTVFDRDCDRDYELGIADRFCEDDYAFAIPIVIVTPSTSHSFTEAKRDGSGAEPPFENPKNFART